MMLQSSHMIICPRSSVVHVHDLFSLSYSEVNSKQCMVDPFFTCHHCWESVQLHSFLGAANYLFYINTVSTGTGAVCSQVRK